MCIRDRHNGYSFFPSELSLVAYNTLFENGSEVVRCYINSVFVTILGTILAVCITAMASYALVTPTVKYSNAIDVYKRQRKCNDHASISFHMQFLSLKNGGQR